MSTSDIYEKLKLIEDTIRTLPLPYLLPVKSIIDSTIQELTHGQAPAKAKKPRKDGDNA